MSHFHPPNQPVCNLCDVEQRFGLCFFAPRRDNAGLFLFIQFRSDISLFKAKLSFHYEHHYLIKRAGIPPWESRPFTNPVS
jgi:hypothetical protein